MPSVFHNAFVYGIEQFLFWGFALGVLFLSPRWAVLCMLLAGNVDVIRPGFVATSGVGWQNGIETLALPTILLLRMTNYRLPKIRWSKPVQLWVVLITYACVSILWSPFKLSGVKMVAYLSAWFILFVAFYVAWRRRLLDQKVVICALWGSLALAYFQTHAAGDPFGGLSHRFTSFAGPNSFAPFLTCLLALLLFSREGPRTLRTVSICACLVALIYSGSRYALIGAAFVLFVRGLIRARAWRRSGHIRVAPVVAGLALAAVTFVGFRAVMAKVMPKSRVNQMLDLTSKPQLADTGTFGFRLMMYADVISRLSHRSALGWVFGTGTSSGGTVVFPTWQKTYKDYPTGMDPNRTIHDEILRAAFEWGLIGLGITLMLWVCAVRGYWRRAIIEQSLAGFAGLSILPVIFLALLIENALSGPASAEGIGYLLVLTYGFTAGRRVLAKPSQTHETAARS